MRYQFQVVQQFEVEAPGPDSAALLARDVTNVVREAGPFEGGMFGPEADDPTGYRRTHVYHTAAEVRP